MTVHRPSFSHSNARRPVPTGATRKPLRKLAPSSIKQNRELLLRLASAVIHIARDPEALEKFRKAERLRALRNPKASEHPNLVAEIRRYRNPSAFKSLHDLILPVVVRAGLHYLVMRQTSEGYRYDIALTAYTAARWVGISKKQEKDLKVLVKELDPKRKGMTPKNLKKLRYLRNSATQKKLINLPLKGAAKVCEHSKPSFADALVVQTMIMIEFAFGLALPLRELLKLKWKDNIPLVEGRRRKLVLPPDVSATLGDSITDLLDLYRGKYFPKLVKGDSPWVFPGRNGRHKSTSQVYRQITGATFRETGLVANPALLRHLRALIHLTAHKEDFYRLMKIIGQKRCHSTKRLYEKITAADDFKTFDNKVVSADQKARAARLRS